MRLPGAHLTYCSNIHHGESWEDVFTALREHVPKIRDHLDLRGAFGLGLRLSARAARSLRAPEHISAFRRWMASEDAYVFTLNGFPYGPFHGTPVKEAVYRPDWSTPERARYTHDLVAVLGNLLPQGVRGSISTVPGAFRLDPSAEAPERLVPGLIEIAYQCWERARDHGQDLCIALEPEPMCLLETTAEAVEFFERHILSTESRDRFARLADCDRAEAERGIRRHLGLCLDTCHAAVEFEDPAHAARQLAAAGLRLAKVQVTAGLELVEPDPQGLRRLEAFAEDTYLHQVVISGPDGLIRLLDLPEALARARKGLVPPGPWRVHLHVPVCADLEGPVRSTAGFVQSALPHLAPLCDHYEVETYTWSVLPPKLRSRALAESIAAELQWTMETWQSR